MAATPSESDVAAGYDKKATARERNRRVMARKRSEGRTFIGEYLKGHPCADCGEADPVVLDFHHVRGVKSEEVRELSHQGRSVSAIWREIQECEVVCANCHRRRHHKDRQTGKPATTNETQGRVPLRGPPLVLVRGPPLTIQDVEMRRLLPRHPKPASDTYRGVPGPL
jgi:hypothetical protein